MWPFGDKVSKQSMSDLVVKGSGASAQSDSTDNKPEAEEDYIIHGLRQDHPDLADIDDATLYEAVRRADFDTPPDDSTYKEIMRRTYVPEEVRNPGVGKVLGEAAKKLPGQLWHGIEGGVMAPFRAEAERAGMMGQSYLGLPAGPSMEAPLNEMEKVSYNDLLKRGYSPEIAKHVMSQRIGTMQELSQGMDTAAEQGGAKAVEGTAFYGSAGPTLPLGGLPGRLATEVAMGITPIATEAMAVKGLAHAVDHAIAGGAGLSGYDMIKAAAEGKSASEIFNAGAKSFLSGAAWGVALPIVGKGIAKTLGKVASTTVEGMSAMVTGTIPRYIEMQESWAAQAQNHALHAQADNFADKFTSDKMRTDFSDISPDLPPSIQAAQIIQRVLGNDVLEVASESSIAKIADKIRSRRAATEALDALETSGSRRLPIPAEMNAQMPIMSPMQQVMPQPEPTPREAMDMTMAQIQAGQSLQKEPMIPGASSNPFSQGSTPLGAQPLGEMKGTNVDPTMSPQLQTMMGTQGSQIFTPNAPLSEDLVPTFDGTFDTWAKKAPEPDLTELGGEAPDPFKTIKANEPVNVKPLPGDVRLKMIVKPSDRPRPVPMVSGLKDKLGRVLEERPQNTRATRTEGAIEKRDPNAGAIEMHSKGPKAGGFVEGFMGEGEKKTALPAKSQKKVLPFTPEKEHNFKTGSKEWFLHKFEHFRDAYKDMPDIPYAEKEAAYGTPEEGAYKQNKRLSNWHNMVGAQAELLGMTKHIKDEKLRNELADEGTQLLKDFDERHSGKEGVVMTSDAEVERANKLLDKVIAALKEEK